MALSFDPQVSLTPFSVIRFPFDFRDGDGPTPKRFLLLGHRAGVAVVLKTTTKLGRYQGVAHGAGVLIYEAGSHPCFDLKTAIEPSNAFAIPHSDLQSHYNRNCLEVLHIFSDDTFKQDLVGAISSCDEVTDDRKPKLIAIVNAHPLR